MEASRTGASNPRATVFVGGPVGEWQVNSQCTLQGPPIASIPRVAVVRGDRAELPADSSWLLRGIATNDRYTTGAEKAELVKRQARIGRPEATSVALILLRKNVGWWALAQDERRAILEEQSHHIAIGLRYLPTVARRLLHCRDLGTDEPFDFLGFLDYAPADAAAFDDMLGELRSTREWAFMDREIDIRMVKAGD